MTKELEKSINVGCNWYSQKEVKEIFNSFNYKTSSRFLKRFLELNKDMKLFRDEIMIPLDVTIDLLLYGLKELESEVVK